MSYCVNCGVELDPDARRCPLCHTPVVNPACPVDESIPPNFPEQRREVEPVNRREAAVLLSALYGVVGVCCVLLNLLFWRDGMPWSMIVAGACAMLWVWTVLPLLLRSAHSILLLGLDLLAVAGLLWLIAAAVDGLNWLGRLALPIWWGCSVVLLFLWYILPRRSILSRCMLVLGSCVALMLWLEGCIDLFLGGYQPRWSLVVAVVGVALMLPLLIIRYRPDLRREVRRRFHF